MSRPPAFSLVMPFHNNPRMLGSHYATLAVLPPSIQRGLEVVICDDASNEDERAKPPPLGMIEAPVSIFRIPPPHIPWSHRCATNIAAHESRGNWLLVTDIDHLVPLETWTYLMDRERRPMLRTDRAYTFKRRNLDGSPYKFHPDSWLFHRSLWDQIGGYDTRYRGHYGQNYAFIERVQHHATIEGLPVPLVRVTRDDIPDASERTLTRKSAETKSAVSALRRQYVADGSFYAHQPLVPYERVTP